jgi:hypothetical protein
MSDLWKHTLAGVVAGFTEAVLLHPTDTVKTRFQSSRVANLYSNPILAFPKIVREEGFRALYKGLWPIVAVVIPRVAIQYTGLGFFKPFFDSKKWIPPQSTSFLTGVCTGVVQAVVCVTPLEMIKIRQQTEIGMQNRKYQGFFQTIFVIVREEGPMAMYKGLTATVARQAWGLAVKFSFYNQFRSFFSSISGGDLKSYHFMLSGGLSNIVVGILNSPPDVIKTRLQDQVTSGSTTPKYKNTLHCCQLMLKEEGIKSFFKGASLRVLRIAPGGAIQFATYEAMLKFFKQVS